MRIRFEEVDVDLTLWEFLKAVALGIAICAAPFIIKAVLLAAGL